MTGDMDQTSQAEVLRQIRDEVRAMRREMARAHRTVERLKPSPAVAGEAGPEIERLTDRASRRSLY